ncbi:MAG: hypothetical protein Q8Q08_09270 [Candidatus Omnitrophota bacterium]|nr:hypothetical protein [Candidatus Omnitrophota bacterium]MDZ4241814.1 hypothetical protein [Candidatus Omnitrophota bacterium]
MKTIARTCPQCKAYGRLEISSEGQGASCPSCGAAWGRVASVKKIFERCPVCECRQFYRDKDFNQILGCLIMLFAVVLVPWTYGISLPVFALLDFLLRKRIPNMVVCYRCGTEFRGFPVPEHFKGFLHHIGLKYDKYR